MNRLPTFEALTIGEGTSEILKFVIARKMGLVE